jgi:hypothetical protein
VHCYFDDVTPAGLDPGTWILFVEDFAIGIVDAVAVDILVRYVECILKPVRHGPTHRTYHIPLSRYLQGRSSRNQC